MNSELYDDNTKVLQGSPLGPIPYLFNTANRLPIDENATLLPIRMILLYCPNILIRISVLISKRSVSLCCVTDLHKRIPLNEQTQ